MSKISHCKTHSYPHNHLLSNNLRIYCFSKGALHKILAMNALATFDVAHITLNDMRTKRVTGVAC